jgi:hypothetical protein
MTIANDDAKDVFHYSEDRDDRKKDTGEVFTPPDLVNEMLDRLNIDWCNPPQDKTFLDPTCGSGNFLIELARRRIPLENIYGVDFMSDNIETTKRRLKELYTDKMTEKDIDFHLGRNIIEADALTYHYEFWWYVDPEKVIEDTTGLPPSKVLEKPKKKIEKEDPKNSLSDMF